MSIKLIVLNRTPFCLCFDLAGCTEIMDKQCTDLHIAKIATFLPRWKVVAKLLGLERQSIEDIEDQYPNSSNDQRSEALMMWVRLKGHQATYQNIYDTLYRLEEMDAANKVKNLVTGECAWV